MSLQHEDLSLINKIRDDFATAKAITGCLYPPSFHASFTPFIEILLSDSFRHWMPFARPVGDGDEISILCSSTPDRFLPFMIDQQQMGLDIYGFDLTTTGPEHDVAVWCEHAFVEDWIDFPHFLKWLVANTVGTPPLNEPTY